MNDMEINEKFVIKPVENFYKIKWLDEYMAGHRGMIAGGCFKNIFNDEKVKDVDIFFESEADFIRAVEYYDSKTEDYYFYYENPKVKSYKNKHTGIRIELCRHIFGNANDIISKFDFSIAKFCYYKQFSMDEEGIELIDYSILCHKDFFEHLQMKRIVIDGELLYPISSFERLLRYAKYGYMPCRESKENILRAIKETENLNDLSLSLYDGID